ncbi:MAG: amino acid ABC transporter substrate-binding protein [Rhodospirillaceae bacterium]|nr:amino acid ABC transporter substrate-binding protein [Rhodospirillaceae bacterium]
MRALKLLIATFLGILMLGIEPVAAGPVLDAIKQRGSFRCGIGQPTPGFYSTDSSGKWTGFMVQFCDAISAAMFGRPDKRDIVVVTSQSRFPALQSGEIDILSATTTYTLSRDSQLGFNFGPVNYYDGQGFLVPKKLGITSALKLDGATICLRPGTTSELNIADYFRANSITYRPIVIDDANEIRRAYLEGRCDVYTTDMSTLFAIRAISGNPADHLVLKEVISKEPLAPTVKHGDDQWFDIMNWVIYALIEAEELGVTQANVESMRNTSTDPRIMRLVGKTPGMGAALGLPETWAYDAIKAVGNYGEIFDRNLGPKTPMLMERGLNELWTRGGLIYSPPVR